MLFLQERAKQGQQTQTVILNERLPHFITVPCTLQVSVGVEARDDFYLIHLHVQGELQMQCQRCLEEFHYVYDNATDIAVCRDDARADQLLEHYECIVSPSLQVCLDDLVIDELHLYAPQSHPKIEDCSSELNQFLTEKDETF